MMIEILGSLTGLWKRCRRFLDVYKDLFGKAAFERRRVYMVTVHHMRVSTKWSPRGVHVYFVFMLRVYSSLVDEGYAYNSWNYTSYFPIVLPLLDYGDGIYLRLGNEWY